MKCDLSRESAQAPRCGGDPMVRQKYAGHAWWECVICGSSDPQRRHGGLPVGPLPPTVRPWDGDADPRKQQKRGNVRHYGRGYGSDEFADEQDESRLVMKALWEAGYPQALIALAFSLTQGRISQLMRLPRVASHTGPMPSVSPEVVAFLRSFRPDIRAFSTKGISPSIWIGWGVMVLTDGVDVVLLTRARPRNPDFPGFRYRSRPPGGW